MSLGWMLFIIGITNTITIVFMAYWLDKFEKKDDEGYYYETYVDDDDDDDSLSGYKWED
jgi:hypothetical protein